MKKTILIFMLLACALAPLPAQARPRAEGVTVDLPALDTFLATAGPDTNYSGFGFLGVGTFVTGEEMHTLIKFDLTSIPANATIESATLTLYTMADYSIFPSTMSAYRVLRPWDLSTVTWNTYDGVNPWQTAGARGALDAASIPSAQLERSGNAAPDSENILTLSAAEVQDMLTTNNGWLLTSRSSIRGEKDGSYLYSSEEPNAALRPRLTINYTTPHVDITNALSYGDLAKIGARLGLLAVLGLAFAFYVVSTIVLKKR